MTAKFKNCCLSFYFFYVKIVPYTKMYLFVVQIDVLNNQIVKC